MGASYTAFGVDAANDREHRCVGGLEAAADCADLSTIGGPVRRAIWESGRHNPEVGTIGDLAERTPHLYALSGMTMRLAERDSRHERTFASPGHTVSMIAGCLLQ